MSVSIEDKIELFRNIIFKDIEESSFERKRKAAESFEQERNRLLAEVEAKRKQIIEEAEKKAEKQKQQIIAKAKSEAYHQLLAVRQQFIQEIIELLIQEAREFVSSEGYREYLAECFAKAALVFENAEEVQLYFTKRDLDDLKEFIAQSIASGILKGRCQLKEAGQHIIGGFYAEDGKHEIQVDYTLRSLIEENRELIGSSLSRRLDEVQGNG